MRLLLEVVVFVALIALAWDRTFRERAADIPIVGPKYFAPASTAAASPAVAANPLRALSPQTRTTLPLATPVVTAAPVRVAQPVPPASPSGAWMWDKEHHSALDRASPAASTRQRP